MDTSIKKDTLFLLDAAGTLFRSYYAIRNMSNSKGLATNALYGFIRALEKIDTDFSPRYICAVFDGKNNKETRCNIYPEYKSNRSGMPDDLIHQLEYAKQYCEYSGIKVITRERVEADDTIGSICQWAESNNINVAILSSDKDLAQLVTKSTKIIYNHKDNKIIDESGVEEIYGVRPDQVCDLLAIMGDSSDNIPGILGVGIKTAVSLLKEFDTLDGILNNIDNIPSKKLQEKVTNGKESALMSQKLASLFYDVDIPHTIEAYEKQKRNIDELLSLYKEMEFSSLLKTLSQEETPLEKLSCVVQIITTLTDLLTILEKSKDAAKTSIFSIPSPEKSYGALSFSYGLDSTFFVETGNEISKQDIDNALIHLFNNTLVVGHDIKQQLTKGDHKYFDILIASQISETEQSDHSLGQLSKQHLLLEIPQIEDFVLEKRKRIPLADADIEKKTHFFGTCAYATYLLHDILEKKLSDASVTELYTDIELPLIPVIKEMEENGVYIDKDLFSEMAETINATLSDLEASIYEHAGKEFNIKSPKQLSEILFEHMKIPPVQKKKKTGYSTNIEVLTLLEKTEPIAKDLIAFRAVEKLRSTYVDALPKLIDETSHRIHPTFLQTGTATGRIACIQPNMQNIPLKAYNDIHLRKAFTPQKEGWCFVSSDYSQIELRIMAHLSQDENLIDAFKKDQDIHTQTAAAIYNVKQEDVSQEMRRSAKAVNFGIMYGQQAFGLAKELSIPLRDAAAFISSYFTTFAGVKTYIEETKKSVRESGFTKTPSGRIRMIPDINAKNGIVRSHAERLAINAPIQGIQSDIIKKAMIRINAELKKNKLESFLILQIHDELVIETKKDELDTVISILRHCMESDTTLSVPLKVDIHTGDNWHKLKD